MALENNDVIADLQQQLVQCEQNRLKIIGALDVLRQIEDSKVAGTDEAVEADGGELSPEPEVVDE